MEKISSALMNKMQEIENNNNSRFKSLENILLNRLQEMENSVNRIAEERIQTLSNSINSRHKILEDLVIENIVSESICLGQGIHSKKSKKIDILSQNEIIYKRDWNEIECVIYKEFNKNNFLKVEEKPNSNSNQFIIFKWLYSHFLDVRGTVIESLNLDKILSDSDLYKTKKYKTVFDLLKAEANEIHKIKKDDKDFKNLVAEYKKKYEKIVNIN